jgi:hypothetical protein
VIKTETVSVVLTTGERQFYWFERPEGFSFEDAERLQDWFQGLHADGPGVHLYGPFKTGAEAVASQRSILFGPDCEIEEGGRWDPAWDKLQ